MFGRRDSDKATISEYELIFGLVVKSSDFGQTGIPVYIVQVVTISKNKKLFMHCCISEMPALLMEVLLMEVLIPYLLLSGWSHQVPASVQNFEADRS